MRDLIPTSYTCPSCAEENEALIDPAGGSRQVYTEDCVVCCRPNVLHIVISEEGFVSLDVESEG